MSRRNEKPQHNPEAPQVPGEPDATQPIAGNPGGTEEDARETEEGAP